MKYFLPGDFALVLAGLFIVRGLDHLFIENNIPLGLFGFIMVTFSVVYFVDKRREYFIKLNKENKVNV